METTSQTEKQQVEEQRDDSSRHKGNKLFQSWVKSSVYDWFLDYLQRISYGETTADQFRMFLYHLQELDEKQQVIVNPRADRLKELRATNAVYGIPETEICIRNKPRKDLSSGVLARMCEMCKIQFTDMWQACQQVKEERRNALK